MRGRGDESQGAIFLAGPPLVKAATGEVINATELGRADTHGRRSGVVDHVAIDDEHTLPDHPLDRFPVRATTRKSRLPRRPPRPPAYPARDLYEIIPTDVRTPYDVREEQVRVSSTLQRV